MLKTATETEPKKKIVFTITCCDLERGEVIVAFKSQLLWSLFLTLKDATRKLGGETVPHPVLRSLAIQLAKLNDCFDGLKDPADCLDLAEEFYDRNGTDLKPPTVD